jgi:hypothetical protein
MHRGLRGPLAPAGALLLSLMLGAGCAEDDGALTARLVFEAHPDLTALGLLRQGLRTAAVPEVVDRLQILALDGTTGATLAETNLWAEPSPGDLPLNFSGGTWELRRVRSGSNRSIVARAFLGPSLDRGLDRALVFVGRIDDLTVAPGELTDAGVLVLRPSSIRVPEADFEAPDPPNPLTITTVPEGSGLRVAFTAPRQTDLEGYAVLLGTSTAAAPMLERGQRLELGQRLGDGWAVRALASTAGEPEVTVGLLEDGRTYGVLVYAFDGDRTRQPLNFSAPARGFASPSDSVAPSAPEMLTARVRGGADVEISFVAPGEDSTIAASGRPAQYEVRAAAARATLEDPATFGSSPSVPAPAVAAPGETVRFVRTLAQLGVTERPIFVAVRALDAAENAGAIAIAELSETSTGAPTITEVSPAAVVAGGEVTLRGADLGSAQGSARLVPEGATEGLDLRIGRWTGTEIVVSVPAQARSGRVVVERVDGLEANAYLAVLGRRLDLGNAYEPPFELIGGARTRDPVSALYREANDFAPHEAAVERLFGDLREAVAMTPRTQDARSSAIAGTYAPSVDRFLFVASDADLSMTTALVRASTVAADPLRLGAGVGAGGADGIGVVVLEGASGGQVPAMLAFTRDGTLRTATVADARFQAFSSFERFDSGAERFDRVTLARNSLGGLLLAHRARAGSVDRLVVRANPVGRDPSAFSVVPAPQPVPMGERIQLLAVPEQPGGVERFLVIYESAEAGGRIDVRLLWVSDVGQRPGYAPLAESTMNRRLEDAGLIVREGRVHVVVLATQRGTNASLEYVEVPLAAIDDAGRPRAARAGSVLDVGPLTRAARVGCKPFPLPTCPILWSDADLATTFFRR